MSGYNVIPEGGTELVVAKYTKLESSGIDMYADVVIHLLFRCWRSLAGDKPNLTELSPS